MKLGFTGTRERPTEAQRLALAKLLEMSEAEELHHGDATGADSVAHHIALSLRELRGWPRIIIHPPSNVVHRACCLGADMMMPEQEYLVRNRAIVDATDKLVAMPKGSEESLRSGTWSTVRFARHRRKPILLIFPDGTTKVEEP